MSHEFLQGMLEHFAMLKESDASAAAKVALSWLKTRELHGEGFDVFFSACESPMERTFLLGLTSMAIPVKLDLLANGTRLVVNSAGTGRLVLIPQYEEFDWSGDDTDSGPYARVDFVLRSTDDSFSLAIEIDGHEFHEKTKEQAARDKLRDRRLVKDGHRVIRFSGAEVYADPKGCWMDVLTTAMAIKNQIDARDEERLEQLTRPEAKQLSESSVEPVEAAAE